MFVENRTDVFFCIKESYKNKKEIIENGSIRRRIISNE